MNSKSKHVSTKRTIILDLGGVLIDWNPKHLYRKVFTDQTEMELFLSRVCSPEWNAQIDRNKPFQQAIEERVDDFPGYESQIRIFASRWEEMLAGEIPGTVEILQILKEAEYPLIALSNWSAETFPIAIERYEFLGWFDFLFISGQIGLVKPEPEIFHHLLREINRNAEECIYIDDSQENIRIAKELGFESILFFSPDQLRESLENLGIL